MGGGGDITEPEEGPRAASVFIVSLSPVSCKAWLVGHLTGPYKVLGARSLALAKVAAGFRFISNMTIGMLIVGAVVK